MTEPAQTAAGAPEADPLAALAAFGPLGREAVEVLQRLIRFDTVNPPGDERACQEWLAAYLRGAGLEVELCGEEPERPNLVARLRGAAPGPVFGLLSHVDTVLADPVDWRHGPWSGELADGCVWGRGAIDMKSQTAAEAVAVASLARSGWRPARGELRMIAVVDEEVGGRGAEWLCAERPDLARCDWLLNEGAGVHIPYDGGRLYDVCVGEKGVFRFTLTTTGVAGHASVPTIADNALLKLAPLLEALGSRKPGWDVTPGAALLLDGLGLTDYEPASADPEAAIALLRARDPCFAALVEPMVRVTCAPTMVSASEQMNVIPARARLSVDCRVPPGMERPAVLARIREVVGDVPGVELDFTEETVGNASSPTSPLMDALIGWVARADPGARCLPALSTGYTDSRTFREHFPDTIAYGFFPQRHMSLHDVSPLVHSHDERIDVRDLALATDCFRDVVVELLG